MIACIWTAAVLAGPPQTSDVRSHKRLSNALGSVLYEYSSVSQVSEVVTSTTFLVRDEGHGEFLMRTRGSFEDQTVVYRISDVKDADFIQISFKLPFHARTRSETLSEARMNPQIQQTPAILKLETTGGRWDGVDADWNEDEALRKLRRDVRQTISFSLLEAIERMRGSLFATRGPDAFFDLLAKYVVYDSASDTPMKGLKVHDIAPSCDFDAHFGTPCTADQRRRVEAALKEGKVLPMY